MQDAGQVDVSRDPLEHGFSGVGHTTGDSRRPENLALKALKRQILIQTSADGTLRTLRLKDLVSLSNKGMALSPGQTVAASLFQTSAFGALDQALLKIQSTQAVIMETVVERLETFLRKVPTECVLSTSWTVDMTRGMYIFVSQKLQAVRHGTSLRRFESIGPQDFLSDDSINLADPAASGIEPLILQPDDRKSTG